MKRTAKNNKKLRLDLSSVRTLSKDEAEKVKGGGDLGVLDRADEC